MSESKDMFPAGAGMNRSGAGCECSSADVPRGSGDEPAYGRSRADFLACSPRERG